MDISSQVMSIQSTSYEMVTTMPTTSSLFPCPFEISTIPVTPSIHSPYSYSDDDCFLLL